MTPFLRSKWVEAPDGSEELDPGELAPGFRAAGVACGIKDDGAPDLGLLLCDGEASSAALFTSNAAAAAPVRVCRERAELDALRAVVASSGNANAGTGPEGYERAVAMQEEAALRCEVEPASVAVASTGQIGIPLPIDAVRGGIGDAAAALDHGGAEELAKAIMTTDRGPKLGCVRADGVTVSAQAKGAGMVQPGFATTLCFVQTDAVVEDPELVLRAAGRRSFERITVDGQQSTNDTVVLQASGASGKPLPEGLLDAVMLQLALEVVADGEGATRVARIRVTGAAGEAEADRVARAIANSPLVQSALHGRDPNWGRIVQAAGMALAGHTAELDEGSVEAGELGSDSKEAELSIDLGRGEDQAVVYFSDLSCDYVRLNAELLS
jgi:glutamate N-acetyltransferase/amino-acid N-acetyltransferase